MGTGELVVKFLYEGILHILKGWDHVFFVVGLLLLAPNLRSLITVITAFTAAHSITLILASLGLIHVTRPQIVEAIIAASVPLLGSAGSLPNTNFAKYRAVAIEFLLVTAEAELGKKSRLSFPYPGHPRVRLAGQVVHLVAAEPGIEFARDACHQHACSRHSATRAGRFRRGGSLYVFRLRDCFGFSDPHSDFGD
jgi:hypothetical protein